MVAGSGGVLGGGRGGRITSNGGGVVRTWGGTWGGRGSGGVG